MQRTLLFSLLLLLLIPGILFAQSGKIRGIVTDAKTKEPLIGANISIVNSKMGAATNINGSYVVLNVPVGTYSIKATYIGYHPVTITNIRVNTDLSTDVSLQMTSEDVQVQAVEIVADRPLVNKSATSSIRIADADFIAALPSRGINSVINLQPGVVAITTAPGVTNFYIRGGRFDETGFTLEGANITDVVAGGRGISIVDAAIEQVQVMTGGYTAEFGGSNAGLVRTDLKSGGQKLSATVLGESDQFTSQGKKSLGTYSYGYRDVTVTLGGPLFINAIKFFASYQNTHYADPDVSVWDGFSFNNVSMYPAKSALHPTTAVSDVIDLYSQSGNSTGGKQDQNNFAGTLLGDFGGLKLRLGVTYATSKYKQPTTVTEILDVARLPITDSKNSLVDFKVTDFLNKTTYVEASVNYTYQDAKRYDPDFKDDLFAYGDQAKNAALGYIIPSDGEYFDPYQIYLNGKSASYINNGYGFYQYGTPLVGPDYTYYKNKTVGVGGRVDVVSQLSNSVELKVGGEYKRYTYRSFTPAGLLQWAVAGKTYGTTGTAVEDKIRSYGSNNIGYDALGNEIDDAGTEGDQTVDFGAAHPKFGGAYAQTKVELADVIMNLGLRFDYIDADAWRLVDPNNVKFDGTTGLIRTDQLSKTPSYEYLTPRLGFSFPVNDKTSFHAQYGKFVQYPRLANVYRGLASMSAIMSTGYFYQNTTGFGLRPERTTSYEIGFSQQVSDFASLDVTAFYKDIEDQIQYALELPSTGATNKTYPVYTNGDYATTRGLEFRFAMRRIKRFEATINYTLSDAAGTGSASTSLAGTVVSGASGQIPKFIFPTEFNQTHRGNISLDYRYAKNEGGPILEQLGVNLLASFNSGTNYTRITSTQNSITDPRNNTPIEEVGASTTPWCFQLDGRIDKTVQLGPISANIYIYVINILGRDNVVSVFRKTGSATDDGWFSTVQGQADADAYGTQAELYQTMYNAINLGRNSTNYVTGASNFSVPRQIRFGVKIEL
jgi:hypothetical protein